MKKGRGEKTIDLIKNDIRYNKERMFYHKSRWQELRKQLKEKENEQQR